MIRFKIILLLLVTLFLLSTFQVRLLEAAHKQPNVIVIYTDDQGSVDANCFGAKDLITPNIDGLAKRGVKFTQFYAAAPVCSPSRASLLTGRYPQRAQLAGNSSSQKGGKGMPTEQITMAETFKAAGYVTGHIGKWHLGYTPETMPNGQGFDYSFGHMGGCIDNYSHFFYWQGPNRHDLWRNGEEIFRDGEFFGDLMVEEMKQFLDKNQRNPFFVYWAINMPHYPLQGTTKWREKYADLEPKRAMYNAFVSTMDENIGQVVKHLDDLKLLDGTIIVFQSDHGHSYEERTFGGGGSSGPYRGGKFCLFEGGIRVPAIISWPGHLPEDVTRDQLATNIDWYPTLAELCRVELPEKKIDGKSLVKVIQDEKAETEHETFCWKTGRASWAVRKGDWKLHVNPFDPSKKFKLLASDKFFLVNLKEDVEEKTNVAKDHPKLVEELKQIYQDWLKEVPTQ